MTRLARVAFAVPLLAVPLLAQVHVNPPVRRIHQAWPDGPTFHPGPMRDLAVGSFVPHHPGRGVVVLRGSDLFLFQQPTVFDHCAPAGSLGLRSIDVLKGFEGRPDRLAAVSPLGLHVLALQATGFGDANAGPIASWSIVDEISTGVFDYGGQETTYVLGRSSGAVALAIVNSNATVTPVMGWAAPGAAGVLDACLVNWVAGGHPEVAVQLTAGFTVLTSNGAPLRGVPGNVIAGRITAWDGPVPGVVRVLQAQSGTSWTVDTVFDVGVAAGGTLVLPQPLVGIASVSVNMDAFGDLVVSSQDSVRRVLVGTANGPHALPAPPAEIVEVYDNNPLPVGTNLAPAVVADVDDDERPDLVIAQEVGDELLVIPSIKSQLMTVVWGNQLIDADNSVGWLEALGHDADVSGNGIPGSWTSGGALGLRLQLPADLGARNRLLVTCYPIPPVGGAMHHDDPVLLTPTHWVYDVGPPETGQEGSVDVLLPFTPPPTMPTPADQRYWLEIRLVEESADGFTNSNTPLCLGLGFNWSEANTVGSLANKLTDEHVDGWWFDWLEFPWNAVAAQVAMTGTGCKTPNPVREPSPGNRFVGLIDVAPPLKKKKTSNGLPPPNVPQHVNAAAQH